jgi:thiol-disulfide isomerase/thioredoxin
MIRFFFFLLLLLQLTVAVSAQEVQIVKIEDLKKIYNRPNDTTYVVNFFATWCGPCMMEIPMLNQFQADHETEKIQLLMVSLDNGKTMKKLPALIKKMKIQAPVYLLNESGDFSWLPYIDKRWQGSIPATMVVNSKKTSRHSSKHRWKKDSLSFI